MKFEGVGIPTKIPRDTFLWTYNVDNYESINQEILQTLSEYRKTHQDNYTDSININVFQTNWNMENENGFREICEIAKEFTIEIATDHYKFPNFRPDIVDCWCNVYNKDSGCTIHQHFPSTFSLVYYVQVPEKSGDIFFPDLEIRLTPKPGLLLCFRGDTWHGVHFNTTDQDRSIIGINIVYKNEKNKY